MTARANKKGNNLRKNIEKQHTIQKKRKVNKASETHLVSYQRSMARPKQRERKMNKIQVTKGSGNVYYSEPFTQTRDIETRIEIPMLLCKDGKQVERKHSWTAEHSHKCWDKTKGLKSLVWVDTKFFRDSWESRGHGGQNACHSCVQITIEGFGQIELPMWNTI